MRIVLSILSLSLVFLCSCSPDAKLKQQLLEAELALAETQKALEEAIQAENEDLLVHTVFLKLKDGSTDEDKAACIAQLARLSELDMVEDFKVGDFEELGDVRAMSDYDIGILVTLKDKEAYTAYQTHALHVEVRDHLKAYLGAPPLTYDFFNSSDQL